MAFITGVTMKVLVNQYDMSSYFRSLNAAMNRDLYDTTAFGSTQKTAVPGFTVGTFEGEILWEDPIVGTPAAPGNVFYEIEQSSIPPIVSVAPEGLAAGKRLWMIRGQKSTHTLKSTIDSLNVGNATFQSNDGFDVSGVSLHDLTAETSFPVTGTSVDNAAGTANGGVGFLHVTAIAGASPNLTFKIQHSTNNSTWADLITFTAVTAVASERILVAAGTTVNRYLRATVANTGTTSSVNFVAGFARR